MGGAATAAYGPSAWPGGGAVTRICCDVNVSCSWATATMSA